MRCTYAYSVDNSNSCSHSAIAMEYMATVGQREEDTGDFGAQTGYSDSEECAENGTGERRMKWY